VDACDEAAKTAAAAAGGEAEQPSTATFRDQPAPAPKATGAAARRSSGVTDEMEGFVEDDEMDAEGEFGD
jgi:hypothetical protein